MGGKPCSAAKGPKAKLTACACPAKEGGTAIAACGAAPTVAATASVAPLAVSAVPAVSAILAVSTVLLAAPAVCAVSCGPLEHIRDQRVRVLCERQNLEST